MDIVGGATASLCEAWREVARADDGQLRVNLLFDFDSDAIRVEAADDNLPLRIKTKMPRNLLVRIPPWAEADGIAVDGLAGTVQIENGHLRVSEADALQGIAITFPSHEEEIGLEHRTHSIRTKLRGDSVIAMENFGVDFTFFQPL
jgi:hypothetical protein